MDRQAAGIKAPRHQGIEQSDIERAFKRQRSQTRQFKKALTRSCRQPRQPRSDRFAGGLLGAIGAVAVMAVAAAWFSIFAMGCASPAKDAEKVEQPVPLITQYHNTQRTFNFALNAVLDLVESGVITDDDTKFLINIARIEGQAALDTMREAAENDDGVTFRAECEIVERAINALNAYLLRHQGTTRNTPSSYMDVQDSQDQRRRDEVTKSRRDEVIDARNHPVHPVYPCFNSLLHGGATTHEIIRHRIDPIVSRDRQHDHEGLRAVSGHDRQRSIADARTDGRASPANGRRAQTSRPDPRESVAEYERRPRFAARATARYASRESVGIQQHAIFGAARRACSHPRPPGFSPSSSVYSRHTFFRSGPAQRCTVAPGILLDNRFHDDAR